MVIATVVVFDPPEQRSADLSEIFAGFAISDTGCQPDKPDIKTITKAFTDGRLLTLKGHKAGEDFRFEAKKTETSVNYAVRDGFRTEGVMAGCAKLPAKLIRINIGAKQEDPMKCSSEQLLAGTIDGAVASGNGQMTCPHAVDNPIGEVRCEGGFYVAGWVAIPGYKAEYGARPIPNDKYLDISVIFSLIFGAQEIALVIVAGTFRISA